jgi:hypothetical protein
MNDKKLTFKEQLELASKESVDKQIARIQPLLEQAFYEGAIFAITNVQGNKQSSNEKP